VRAAGNLMKALGLTIGKDYSTDAALTTLRYRHIVLLCDADVDGMHITWLVVAWLQKFFPTLLQQGFVKRFISPAIIASKGGQTREFFNVESFNTWYGDERTGWKVKYFKVRWSARATPAIALTMGGVRRGWVQARSSRRAATFSPCHGTSRPCPSTRTPPSGSRSSSRPSAPTIGRSGWRRRPPRR
jgi:hypothetical protein